VFIMANQFKIGKGNTTVAATNGVTLVTFHQTVVVSFDQKIITLNSGGWLTATTKTRINQTANQFDLGFNVYQDKGKWFVKFNNETIPFADNMTFERRN